MFQLNSFFDMIANLGKGSRKKIGMIDSLSSDYEGNDNDFYSDLEKESEDKNKGKSKESSFYETGEDKAFSSSGDSMYSDNFSSEEKYGTKKSSIMGFKWWEYGVLIIEFGLITFVVLIFLNVVPF